MYVRHRDISYFTFKYPRTGGLHRILILPDIRHTNNRNPTNMRNPAKKRHPPIYSPSPLCPSTPRYPSPADYQKSANVLHPDMRNLAIMPNPENIRHLPDMHHLLDIRHHPDIPLPDICQASRHILTGQSDLRTYNTKGRSPNLGFSA